MKNLWNRYLAWREKEKRRYPDQQWLESWERTKAKGKARFVLSFITPVFLVIGFTYLSDYYFSGNLGSLRGIALSTIVLLIVATIVGLEKWSGNEKLYQASMKAKHDANTHAK